MGGSDGVGVPDGDGDGLRDGDGDGVGDGVGHGPPFDSIFDHGKRP